MSPRKAFPCFLSELGFLGTLESSYGQYRRTLDPRDHPSLGDASTVDSLVHERGSCLVSVGEVGGENHLRVTTTHRSEESLSSTFLHVGRILAHYTKHWKCGLSYEL